MDCSPSSISARILHMFVYNSSYAILHFITLKDWIGLDYFGFNGPLRQYFSLYRAVSQRAGRKRRKRIDERKNVQTTPTRTYCKRNRPLPYYHPDQQDAPELEVYPAPLHHPTTPYLKRIVRVVLNNYFQNGSLYLNIYVYTVLLNNTSA